MPSQQLFVHMSELPLDGTRADDEMGINGGRNNVANMMENMQNKRTIFMNKLNSQPYEVQNMAAAEKQQQQVHTSSNTSSSSRVSSKRSQMMHHSLSTSEMKQQQQQNESSKTMENLRNFSRSVSLSSSSSAATAMSSSTATTTSSQGLKLAAQRGFSVDRSPIGEEPLEMEQAPDVQEMKFEQKRVMQASKMKVMTDAFSAEKVAASNQEMKRLQTGDKCYEEKLASSALKEKLETESFSAEKIAGLTQEQRQMTSGDVVQQEQRVAAAASMKLATEGFSAEKMAHAKQEERQTISSQGVTHQETHLAKSSSSKLTITAKGICTKSSSSLMTSEVGSGMMSMVNGMSSTTTSSDYELSAAMLDDLNQLRADSSRSEVEKAKVKYMGIMRSFIKQLKSLGEDESLPYLSSMNVMMCKAWAVPSYGHELGSTLCNILRIDGGLDIIIQNFSSIKEDVQFANASVLEQCLITENRAYVAEKGLEKVVQVARDCSTCHEEGYSRVGTGILEHLFKHSEGTCSDVIRLGGLDAILYKCRCSDVETLRHCANALANLSLYGGSENQQQMIKRKVPVWLFPLAFHNDDNIKYYACLAIAALVANKEIEAAVLKSGTLDLVEPFITSHTPVEFATSNVAHAHGQSKNWLQRLVPVLNSNREEARSLSAFHFSMEAGIKKKQGNTEIFREIGAIEPLKKVASSPNAIASKYAAQALRLIGEEVPHKLSQQVPLWTVEDVIEWVAQIGFSDLRTQFVSSRVDGDLLLQLTEENLRVDIGILNGILRKRFIRELAILKKMADYSSCDPTNLDQLLQNIGSEYSQYTYPMLHSGIDKDALRYLTEEQLAQECSIDNSIHRLRIMEAVRNLSGITSIGEEPLVTNKNLDVFVSYRRSNGSQLASLLKVHLQLRSFSVFIDVERLEAGKFDINLLQSIRQAKHFLLVLTPNALDRCINDTECKDWVHREIVTALDSQCNIIPIIDNFQWPEPENLPEDMRPVCYFNGVRWIHDYQDACVDKLEGFIRGDRNVRSDSLFGRFASMGGSAGTPGTPGGGRCGVYQRSQSNESKGSLNSDKDSRELNGNGSIATSNGSLPPLPRPLSPQHYNVALGATSSLSDIEVVKVRYLGLIKESFEQLNRIPDDNYENIINHVSEIMRRVWQVPCHGFEIGTTICNFLRKIEALETLIRRLMDHRNEKVKLKSATVLEQCLTADNCNYIAKKYLLDQVLDLATKLSTTHDPASTIPGTGILAHLTKSSEQICRDVIDFGVANAVLSALQSSDVNTLRNCVIVLTNFCMYGTDEPLQHLLKENTPKLLYDLISSSDDHIIKFYAFFATVFFAFNNVEAKNVIFQLGTLTLVEPFLKRRLPSDIRQDRVESKEWLKKIVYLLRSSMEEARMLSSFYLALEAQIQKKRLNTEIFWKIEAINPLTSLKTSSIHAHKALQLISENVREWDIKDVIAWINHIGFAQFEGEFKTNCVNGEALLILTEEDLKAIGLNSIRSKSFMNELNKLKMKDDLYAVNNTCLSSMREKPRMFDIFISYRRSTGKHLASLVNKYLVERKYSVFIDVDELESGLFDEQLFQVIANASIFILLLTPGALTKCYDDPKDWILQEISAASKSGCTFIPIMSDTESPKGTEYDTLPEEIKFVLRHQGMNWDHANKIGSINKLEEYIIDALSKQPNKHLNTQKDEKQ
uniref:ADP-ribosyl cyclase/cyclic ADP-ribose hydrolase n=1 Tax=Strigamia maritima TaxID=126957 RepID=T1J6E6_STRMM